MLVNSCKELLDLKHKKIIWAIDIAKEEESLLKDFRGF